MLNLFAVQNNKKINAHLVLAVCFYRCSCGIWITRPVCSRGGGLVVD